RLAEMALKVEHELAPLLFVRLEAGLSDLLVDVRVAGKGALAAGVQADKGAGAGGENAGQAAHGVGIEGQEAALVSDAIEIAVAVAVVGLEVRRVVDQVLLEAEAHLARHAFKGLDLRRVGRIVSG